MTIYVKIIDGDSVKAVTTKAKAKKDIQLDFSTKLDKNDLEERFNSEWIAVELE